MKLVATARFRCRGLVPRRGGPTWPSRLFSRRDVPLERLWSSRRPAGPSLPFLVAPPSRRHFPVPARCRRYSNWQPRHDCGAVGVSRARFGRGALRAPAAGSRNGSPTNEPTVGRTPTVATRTLFADEERDRINAFDWYFIPPDVARASAPVNVGAHRDAPSARGGGSRTAPTSGNR